MNDKSLEETLLDRLRENQADRRSFIDKLFTICEPTDLMYLCNKVDEYKRDFLSLLPAEIVEIILGYLDWQTLLNCCQVSSNWNKKISQNFNKLWHGLCIKHLALNDSDDLTYINDANLVNYKQVFVDLMKRTNDLENGRLFRTWNFGPAEIEALASYKNILATATHIVKFWKLEELNPLKSEWICFKRIQLHSRALSLKFNENYLVVSTYFLTIDLYSLQSDQFLCQYMGHTCSISCFDFSPSLMLIATGSADNTIKYWSMNIDQEDSNKLSNSKYLIKTDSNLVWPVRIKIETYNSSDLSYLVIALCANGLVYLNSVEKIEDFIRDGQERNRNNFDEFNFNHYKLKFSNTFKSLLHLQNPYSNSLNFNEDFLDDYSQYLIISNKSWIQFVNNVLTVYAVSDNNSNQRKKFFIKQWSISKNLEYDIFEFVQIPIYDTEQQEEDTEENDYFGFLNKRSLKAFNINQFEIVSFGFNFCLFVDDSNQFYLVNFKTKIIKCIQKELGIDNKVNKVFRLMSNNTQEQFVFSNKSWLNGFRLNKVQDHLDSNDSLFAFAFYTQKRNEVFVIGWENLK